MGFDGDFPWDLMGISIGFIMTNHQETPAKPSHPKTQRCFDGI